MRRAVLTRKEMLHLLSGHSGGDPPEPGQVSDADYRIALLRELGTGELSGELADLLRDAVAPSLLLRWQ